MAAKNKIKNSHSDDDSAILRIIILVLENNGYDVNTAHSGE